MAPAADHRFPREFRLTVRDLTIQSGFSVVAVVAMELARVAPVLSLGLLLATVVCSAAWILVPMFRAGQTSPGSFFGRRLFLRAVLAAATALTAAEAAAAMGRSLTVDQHVSAGVAVCLVIGAGATERLLSRLARAKIPFTAGLPGVAQVPPVPDLARLIIGANLFAIALGGVVGLTGVSWWWWTAGAVVCLLPAAALGLLGRYRVAAGRRVARAVPGALAAYAPEFIVYTSRPDDASYQVTMWLPHLQRAGRRFLIVTRNREPAEALAAVTDVPVVELTTTTALEALLVPSLRAAFYVNASSGNGAFIRHSQITHVYLGHGDSDKPPSYNPTHAMYDRIFAAGPAATRRYAEHGVLIPDDKFTVVGRPQVAEVRPAEAAIAEVSEPTVLYAPTWRGHVTETKFDSLLVGAEIVRALLQRKARVVFRPHPFSYSFAEDAAAIHRIQQLLAEDARKTGRDHVWGAPAEQDRSILDCINESDAMVSDVSSVVSDYLFSTKPFAMVAVPSAPGQFVADYPIARAAYVLAGDLTNLDRVLDDLLGSDPGRDRRVGVRNDYLGDFPAEGYADVFVRAVQQLTDAPNLTEEAKEETGEEGPPASPLSGLRREVGLLARLAVVTGGAALTLLASVRDLVGWSGALAALTLAAVVFAHRRDLRKASARNRLLGTFDVSRAVLVITAGGLWTTVAGARWASAATVLLIITLGAERTISGGWKRRGLECVGLPELRVDVSQPYPRWLVPVSHTVTLVLGFGLVLSGGPAVLWCIAAVLQAVLTAGALVRSQVRALRSVRAEGRLTEVLARHAPEFAVYFASTMGAAYQLGMWLPYFDRIGRPYVIVVRDVAMMREIAALTSVPVVHRPTLRSLEDVMVPSLTTAFYVNNAVRNTHFIERRELTHVWLNHGDSEKPACYNPVHAIYDLIFAAGQAGVDRYARHGVEIPDEKFRVVGRPQVEQIEPARGPIAGIQEPTVLYAPTWQGPYADSRVYSLPQGTRIVQALLDRGVRVVFRAHPFNYRFPDGRRMVRAVQELLRRDSELTGRQHRWGPVAEQEMSVEDCFNASDAMISDVSAVVSDYLQSGKPFSMVCVGHTLEELHTNAPASRAAYVLDEDLGNMDHVLDQLLRTDPLVAERDRTRAYYLGDFPAATYADGFLDAARTVIDVDRPAAADRA